MPAGTPVKPATMYGEPVPVEGTGYAVGETDLRVGDGFFELDFSTAEMSAIKEAVRWHDGTPNAIVEEAVTEREGKYGFRACTLVGDMPALRMLVKALKAYEEQEADLGEDKAAYDARTALNHSRYVVKERLMDETDD
jgi:hypothetical protein